MKVEEVKLSSYITGFILSLIFTLAAYLAVVAHLFSGWNLVIFILILAIIQLIIQMIFFLYLAQESGQHLKLGVFISTIGLVLIVVVGSIWIMNHLNYNMSPMQMNQYLQNQAGGF